MNQRLIKVHVQSSYLDRESKPGRHRYAFTYTVTIENLSDAAARLISRHWIITDASNSIQEVDGIGVVGEQPRILPSGSYTYTSGVILKTPVGTMEGMYEMQTDNGETFNVLIPAFTLTRPQALH